MKKLMLLFFSILLLISCKEASDLTGNKLLHVINQTKQSLAISVQEEGSEEPSSVVVLDATKEKGFRLEKGTAHSISIALLDNNSIEKYEETIVITKAIIAVCEIKLTDSETNGYIFISARNGEIEPTYSWNKH